ncbi:hypothetical protein SARC_05617 [Sphaeroforma arctica JP610]|uniref:Uncharacterized protein n=1 Tax=Sphaeroforma arctica JP610 TaxID=667725 RepID=A0A0L0G1P2_9EUKA|nr:hypothetical protein SARC_05617 [Sphaeroforma arctica JP610]KNC82088.1 hypothetical protein SARC_05617 [Sphaeroforma arctica JP610]|eukprot:XP_014155990.1 hypothetical protein SARC_05617 [Sphaeroforma arctica JP610]
MRLVDLYPAHDQICADCDAQVEDIVDSWMPIEALFAILPSPATEHLKCVSESTVSLLNGWSILQTQEFPNSKMILEMALWKRQQGEVQSEDRSPCVDDDVLAIGFNGLDRNSKKKSPIDTCASAEILSEKLQRRSVVGETVEEIHASAAQYGQHQRQAHDWSKKCYRALLQKIQKRAPKNAIVETAAQLLRTLLHLWQDTAEDTFRSSALNVHQLMQTYTDKNKVEAGIIVLPVFAIVTGNTTKSQIQSLHRDHWVLSASGLPYSIVISGVKKQCYSGDLDEVMQRKTLHHPCRSEDLHTNVYNQEMPADFEEFIPTLDLSAPGGSALFQGKHSFQDYEDERARSHVQDERDGVMSKESIIKETMDTIKNDFEVLAQRRGDTEEPQSVADMVIADLEAQFFEAQRMKARPLYGRRHDGFSNNLHVEKHAQPAGEMKAAIRACRIPPS